MTIAGSDSSGGAGIEADLRAFDFLQIPACVAVTAVTAQGPGSIKSIDLVDPEVIKDQIEMARQLYEIRAAKIGMLGSEDQVQAVAHALKGNRPRYVVLDPVTKSTSGTRLLTENGVHAMIRQLLPMASVVTPNIDELHELTKMPVDSKDDRITAAKALLEYGVESVLIKGGHLDGWPVNTLIRRDQKPYETYTKRVETQHTRGTGCLLSALIAGYLAAGHRIENAIRSAGEAVYRALESPVVPREGNGYPNLFGRSNSVFNPDRISGIYFVSSTVLNPQVTHTIGARLALEGGASVIQLREKSYSPNELVRFAKRMKKIAEKRNGLFIVNDRVDIALAADADGVHLGPDDLDAESARRILGPAKVIGASVSTRKEASVIAEFCDYLAVGAIFGSATKGDAGDPVGVERVTEIKNAFPDKKIVAIGGINLSNIASVAAAGADAAAVVSAIVCAAHPEQAARELLAEFNRGKAQKNA